VLLQPPPPPSSYFNNWAGSYNPVDVQLSPAPNIQSYVYYQSLPPQALLQEQQTAPSTAFGPHTVKRKLCGFYDMNPCPQLPAVLEKTNY